MNIDGVISFDESFRVASTQSNGRNVTVRANSGPINFDINPDSNNNSVVINTNGNMTVVVSGIVYRLNSITYNKGNNTFSTSVEETGPLYTQRGIVNRMIGAFTDGDVRAGLNSALQRMFGNKMRSALRRIRELRGSRTLSGGSSEVASIIRMFGGPGSGSGDSGRDPLPNFNISTRLSTRAPNRARLSFGNRAYAHIPANQRLEVFVRQRFSGSGRNRRVRIRALSLRAPGGIEINQSRNNSSFLSGTVRAVSLSDRNGLQIDADNSVDGTIAILGELFELASTDVGQPPTRHDCDCRVVQSRIEGYVTDEIKSYVRSNRSTLLRAGFTSQFLNAVQNDRVGTAIDHTEFMIF